MPGPNSGDAFDREIASDGLNAITWFKTNRDLILGTLNEEFLIKSSDGKAISNTNISILGPSAVPQGDGFSPQLKVIVSTLHSFIALLNTLCGALSAHTTNKALILCATCIERMSV
jgi:hypothetical protein